MKKILFYLAISSCFPVLAQSNQWRASHVEYTQWEPLETHCENWLPNAQDVDVNKLLRQQARCRTKEQRERITFERHAINKAMREQERKVETRLKEEVKWRNHHGERDRLIEIVYSEHWDDWQDEGEVLGCRQGVNVTELITLDQNYLYTEHCQQPQVRQKPIVEWWLSGKHVRRTADEEREERVVDRLYLSFERGSQDRWLAPQIQYGGWQIINERCNTSPFGSEILDAVKWGEIVAWPLLCEQRASRDVKKSQKSLSGKTRELSVAVETQDRKVSRFNFYSGQKDHVTSESWVAKGNPIFDTSSSNCVGSSLPETAVQYGVPYFDYLKCEGNALQSESLIQYYASGKTVANDERKVETLLIWRVAQMKLGSRDTLLNDDNELIVSEWVAVNSARCDYFNPSHHLISKGQPYVRTATCLQDERQDRSQVQLWLSGEKTVALPSLYRTREWESTEMALGTALKSFSAPLLAVKGNGREQSFPVFLGAQADLQRLAVTVNRLSGQGDVNVKILTANGVDLSPPPLDRDRGTYFFRLYDHQAEVQGTWTITVNAPEGADVSVSLNFTQE